ncbi:MAG: NAD(P)-dependent alcohol dehydrogenase [Candidatus Thorarchaeota archaeon]|nr:NAD(P)-dependent alcohol dehydrogenase [Candidatus Thorarchaeota archaeon]
MKAIVATKYGPPEVLQLTEIENPKPKPNEILIRNYATTVSAGDVRMRSFNVPRSQWLFARLYLGLRKPGRAAILGMELSGEVEAIGSDVAKFEVGDQVFASTLWSGFGGYAEYKCMPEDGMVTVKPSNMSFEEAAPVLGGGLTAAKILRENNIREGQDVLIYGASGSVGTYAIQIAKHFGASVTAVCSTTNLELMKSLGADNVVDYTQEDFTRSGATYDVIFDAVDKLSLSDSRGSLKDAGTYLNVDSSSGGMGKSEDHIEYLTFLKGLTEAGDMVSVIDRTYPLEQIVEAHRYVETGHKKGNVVIILGTT